MLMVVNLILALIYTNAMYLTHIQMEVRYVPIMCFRAVLFRLINPGCICICRVQVAPNCLSFPSWVGFMVVRLVSDLIVNLNVYM